MCLLCFLWLLPPFSPAPLIPRFRRSSSFPPRNRRIPNNAAMDTNTFRRFVLVSSLFIAAPLPLAAAIGLKGGDWTTPLRGLAFSAGLCFLYWWPLGAFLSWYHGRMVRRFFWGYALSLPSFYAVVAISAVWRQVPAVAGRAILHLLDRNTAILRNGAAAVLPDAQGETRRARRGRRGFRSGQPGSFASDGHRRHIVAANPEPVGHNKRAHR